MRGILTVRDRSCPPQPRRCPWRTDPGRTGRPGATLEVRGSFVTEARQAVKIKGGYGRGSGGPRPVPSFLGVPPSFKSAVTLVSSKSISVRFSVISDT